MKIKRFILAIALAISTNAQAIETTTPMTTIQGGSNANAVWHAPLNQNYNVWVFVPNHATAVNALYRLYPKGKKPRSTECSASDFNYPCIEIAVNQALNKNKWVQLTVNNNTDSAWLFVGGKGYVTVASNTLSTTESLGVAGVRFVPNYALLISQNWQKTIPAVAALKLAISECLNDTSGNYAVCDSMSASELGKYGITALPDVDGAGSSVVTLIATTAAIQIAGDATLGGCTFQFQPTVNFTAGTISWQTKATAAATGQVAECVQYLKNSTY